MDANTPWPYSFWIAHRGAGKLAPENTLAAFRLGARHGYRMFECDAKLSADGVPFLLHDDTLERTTDGHGTAGGQPWATLAQLDAGGWHSPTYAGEPLPTLANVARYCLANQFCLNIEIKPTPGQEAQTGRVVAEHAARLWQAQAVQPLLSSFSLEALAGAQASAPQLPRGLLLDEWRTSCLDEARALGCVALLCHYTLWNAARVASAKAVGLRTLSYTVNDAADVQRLMALSTDGLITDRVDLFSPAAATPGTAPS
ncbi:MAG: glycerophosphodiester phosphodiesterase [Polaromonas sp.]